MDSTIEEILSSPVVKNTIRSVFHKKPFSVIERPGAFILELGEEPTDKITRMIILKPRGFTANSLQELSSHPEAREAVIEIKGAARGGNRGYSLLKKCLEFVYYPTRHAKTLTAYPYAKAEHALRLVKNSRTKFKVVKPSGYGFYHNLHNLTKEWLVLILDKKLDLTKEIDYEVLDNCSEEEKRILLDFLRIVRERGDAIFGENNAIVEKVISLRPGKSLPALISFLNIPEMGKHEQCTVFAVILKIARKDKTFALKLLAEALAKNAAQPYYLSELIEKIS